MKKLILFLYILAVTPIAFGQITITAADMPVSGDTLRYSIADPAASTAFSVADSGTAKTWDFSSLVSLSQAVDTFKLAMAVNPTYALTISPTAYGYKIADSFPGLSKILPITFNNLYTFFNKKTSPPRYVAEGFAAVISGIPTPANYSDEDEWYFFPLSYLSTDSSTFSLKFSLPGVLTIKQAGYRKTRVDGWGTIKTPYFTTPVNCIRVRSEIHEIDSFDITITKLGLPRNSVEYKFLVNGEHYPAVWVTTSIVSGTETVNSVRYRDGSKTTSAVRTAPAAYRQLKLSPNPVQADGIISLDVPADWIRYHVDIFDLQSRLVAQYENTGNLDVSKLAAGNYAVRVTSGTETGIVLFTR